MASLTRTEARDEMLGVVHQALQSYDAGFTVMWEDKDNVEPPKHNQAYAEGSVNHLSGQQTSMGGKGNSSYTRYGYVEILVLTPEGDGLTLADTLATIVQDAFEGVTTSGGVIFRNVRATEAGKRGKSRVTNVTADFEYDQIK